MFKLSRIGVFYLACAIALLFLLAGALSAESLLHQPNLEPVPYHPGERLVYRVKIRGLSAGRWDMRVLDATHINGRKVYHFESKATTNSFFRKLYAFRDSQTSYVSQDDFSPLRYQKEIQDGSYQAEITVDFQHDKGQASQLYNGRQRQIDIPTGIQDELSMVYLLRRKQLAIGKKYEFDLLTLKQLFHVEVQIVRRERIKTILGKRETLVLRSTHGYQIWLTNDERRIPVKIEAETRAGKLTGILEAIE